MKPINVLYLSLGLTPTSIFFFIMQSFSAHLQTACGCCTGWSLWGFSLPFCPFLLRCFSWRLNQVMNPDVTLDQLLPMENPMWFCTQINPWTRTDPSAGTLMEKQLALTCWKWQGSAHLLTQARPLSQEYSIAEIYSCFAAILYSQNQCKVSAVCPGNEFPPVVSLFILMTTS